MLRFITQRRRMGRVAAVRAVIVVAMGLLPIAACSNLTDPLLEAEDPDILSPENVNSAEGALAIYRGTLVRLTTATGGEDSDGDEGTWMYGGLLADEYGTSSTFVQNDEVDIRRIQTSNSRVTAMYRELNRVRTAASQAIVALTEWHPDSTVMIAEMYFVRGFAEMQLAQDFCSAIPLSDASGEEGVLDGPQSTEQVFARAAESFEAALDLVGDATTENGVRIAQAARVGLARALLGNGRYAEAGAAVRDVPTSYSYDITFSLTTSDNIIWAQVPSQRRYLVGDSIEGNARNILVSNSLPFFSAGDPRVPANFTVSEKAGGKKDTVKSQDGSTYSRTTTLYDRLTPIAAVNGIDARLAEAEAAYQAGDAPGMLTILNALRAAPPMVGTVQLTADALPPLVLPATPEAQVDLLFREKAFWTYSRGQRLGELRRLIRQYGRTAENTFPVGEHYRGGEYGTDVNLPVPQQEETNPNFGSAGRAACKQNEA